MNGITLDLTFNIGTIIQIGVIAGGGLLALSKFSTKFALFHADLSSVKLDLTDMKSEIKKVNEVLARANEADRRIGRLEDDFRELRKGEGWITGHRSGLNGEY
jgi:hypothetical protein